ncbi:ArsR/SmtB family transcription factor [Microbacterium sp. 2216-1]|uniref:ArsR/SmtB family transcription factor n=1 Tax=Microbacterium TaxID=33882 RepID=UPI001CD6D167|nr:helix-turn-helix domain-containing protein [Microbacterium esteraromaticum]MCA1307300.1 helix-turn-helix domain-containing protein [Microbacterium esteraromaticum]
MGSGSAEGRSGAAVMTSAMLKALANPLRRRIINELVRREYARAADLSAALEVPANSLSFHLRVLAEAGLVEEDPDRARDRRDRVWKPVDLHALELGTPEQPVADAAAAAAFVALIADEHHELVRRVVTWAPEYTQGRDPVMRGTFEQRNVRLTRAELMQVFEKVSQVFREAEQAHDRDDPDSLFWNIDIVAADETI